MNKPTRVLITALALVAAQCAWSASKHEGVAFHSWYDGYFTHHVWGVGEVKGSYREAYIQCGLAAVPVVATHDTHANAGVEPPAGQSREEVADHIVLCSSSSGRRGSNVLSASILASSSCFCERPERATVHWPNYAFKRTAGRGYRVS
jgi:hypothetical protein